MKIIGLIGGISWVSTIEYYKMINEGVNAKLGDLNFAECMIYSFNYGEIKKNNDVNDWDANLRLVVRAVTGMKDAGAEGILLCANTMHLIASEIEEATGLPVIHIATATAEVIREENINKVALLGTRFTMERDFFKSRLAEKGIEAIIPGEEDRRFIHETIFEELGRGLILDSTRQRYLAIIRELIKEGAGGIILGCTEIPLLIQPADVDVPVFDTTKIHAAAAVDFILS